MRFSVACILMLLAGCRSAQVGAPLTQRVTGGDELEFWHLLARERVTSNDDAFHGILLAIDGKDDSPDYAARVGVLKSRRWLPASFDEPADRAVSRGTVAMILAGALEMKGGVNMRLFGPSPRYALRDLEFRGVFPSSSANQLLRGREFVGLVSKAGDYRATGSSDVAATARFDNARAHDESFASRLNVRDELTLVQPMYAAIMQDGPATTMSADRFFTATVILIEGPARWRLSEAGQWQAVKKGDRLSQDATVETGPRARVVMEMPLGQTIDIGPFTEVTLLEARQLGGKVRTDLGMDRGRVQYEIRGAGVEYESKVRSPNTTLAVRGTIVILYDQPPFTPRAISLTGRAEFLKDQGVKRSFLGGTGTGTAKIDADDDSAAETALEEAIVDPGIAGARTASENELIANLISRGASYGYDPLSGMNVVRGGTPPSTDAQIRPILPGRLNFVLTWDSPADLDLTVSTRIGDRPSEFLAPVRGFDVSRSGGVVPFDHRGGGKGGIEVVYWKGAPPAGPFTLGVVSSGGSSSATVRAYLDGQPLLIDRNGNLAPTQSKTVTTSDAGALIATVDLDDLGVSAKKKVRSRMRVRSK